MLYTLYPIFNSDCKYNHIELLDLSSNESQYSINPEPDMKFSTTIFLFNLFRKAFQRERWRQCKNVL